MNKDNLKNESNTTTQNEESSVKEEVIAHRHDKFFRASLENRQVATELIETYLPEEIKKLIDFNSIKTEKDSFVEKDLSKYICDVLLSAKINGQDGYLYILCEQQSEPDPLMSFRLMRYMINICSRHIKQHLKKKKATSNINNIKAIKLPIIYPIVN